MTFIPIVFPKTACSLIASCKGCLNARPTLPHVFTDFGLLDDLGAAAINSGVAACRIPELFLCGATGH